MIFLKTDWRYLIHVSYEVDPEMVIEYIPAGVELDLLSNGKALVSLIPLHFFNTKVAGLLSIPCMRTFPEINFRIHVKSGNKKGVKFIREYIGKPLLATMARMMYGEPYKVAKVQSEIINSEENLKVKYELIIKKRTHSIQVNAFQSYYEADENSREYFIINRPWGFGFWLFKTVVKYKVEHPKWLMYNLKSTEINVDFAELYGPKWEILNSLKPVNIMMAKGSEVKIFTPTKL